MNLDYKDEDYSKQQEQLFGLVFPVVNGKRTEASQALIDSKHYKTKQDLSDREEALL